MAGIATAGRGGSARRSQHAVVGWLVLALAVPAVEGAGYSRTGQAVFVALAGAALLAAIVVDDVGVSAALRRGPLLVLAALAVVSVLSAAWTLLAPIDSARWGLVLAGYAALAIASAAYGRGPGAVTVIAAAIAVLAMAQAGLGLGAAALRELPYAERIGGSWRPGGSFEYSSALALLEVAALPALLSAMVRARPALSCLAAAGGGLAMGTILLAETRIELVLAAIVVMIALLWPSRTVAVSRDRVLGSVVVVAISGGAIRLSIGGYVAPHAHGGSAARLGALVIIALVTATAWMPLRAAAGRLSLRLPRRVGVWAALAVATAVVVIVLSPIRGRGTEPVGGLLHGRDRQWSAALRAFGDRPVIGGGANAYLAASIRYQGDSPVLYAHDLPLEAAAELGAVGLLLVLMLYGSTAAAVWRARSSPGLWLVAPGVLAFLLANLVDWEWHLPLSGAVWAVGLGAVLALGTNPRVNNGY